MLLCFENEHEDCFLLWVRIFGDKIYKKILKKRIKIKKEKI